MAQDTPLGFPAHTLHPQGVCSIRKAAQPLTAALPYRRGESTTLLIVSAMLFVLLVLRLLKPGGTMEGTVLTRQESC